MKRNFVSELNPTDRYNVMAIEDEKVEGLVKVEVTDRIHTIVLYFDQMTVKRLIGCLKDLK